MSQVPGLGHVTFYRHPGRYPTLFHSPLVGVDKETLATCTLSFTREVRRRNKCTFDEFYMTIVNRGHGDSVP
jgi:hypothetical protein